MTAARRLILLGICAAAVLLSAAASASADNLCVGTPGGACDASFPGPTGLQDALTAAQSVTHPGDDTVRIDANSYSGPFTYASNSNGHVAIVGAGTAQTTLTMPAPPGSATVLSLSPNGESISDLTISVPATSAGTTQGETGLQMSGSTASNIAVTSPTSENIVGVAMSGGVLQQSSITLQNGTVNGNAGVSASGAVDIHDVSIVAEGGINHSGIGGTVSRAHITSAFQAIGERAGAIDVDDSLIEAVKTGGLNGVGLAADDRNNPNQNTDVTINARHVTIVGGGSGTRGIYAVAIGHPPPDEDTMGLSNSTVNLADSVISGPAVPIQASADNHRTATVNTSYSDYNDPADVTSNDFSPFGDGTFGSPAIIAANHTNHPTPGFVNPGTDFHLAVGSPLIDAGDPAGGGPATDFDGNPRIVDAANVCPLTPRRDIGAYEFQPGPAPSCAPPNSATSPDTRIDKKPKRKTTRHRVKFRFSADQPGSSFMCRLDAKPFAPCTSPLKLRVKPGKHIFQVEAVSSAGLSDTSPATTKFRVLP